MKKKYNPFNRAYDSEYKYDFQDMSVLSRYLLHTEDSTVVEPLSMKNETNFDSIIQKYLARPLPTFLPLEVEGAWIALILCPEIRNNPPHKALCYDPLMTELSQIIKNRILESLQKIPNQVKFIIPKVEEGIEEADTGVLVLQYMSLIKENKDPNQLEINGSESTFQQENEKQRQHFGLIYKKIAIASFLQDNGISSKKEDNPNLKIHWNMFNMPSKSEIIKTLRPCNPKQFQDLTEIPDEVEVENLLKYSIENQDVDLAKILLQSGFRVNRGYTTPDFKKVSFLSIIEEEKQKHENIENFQKIQNLLNKYGCRNVDSSSSNIENFESNPFQKENLRSQSQTEIDRFKNSLKTKLIKTIKNKFSKTFDSDIAINEIIDKFINEAIQYASESIQVAMSLKKDKETINKFDKLFQNFVSDYQKNPNISIQQFFQSSKITKQDLMKLDKQLPQLSTFILTKVLHYLEDAPYSAQLFTKPIWLPVVQSVYELDYPKMASLILTGPEKIIISFDSKTRQDFTTFYDQGFYKVFGNEETEKKSLARILEETICQSFKDAEIFIIGNQSGAMIANEFVHTKFKLYEVRPERVHLSLFSPPGEIVNHFCIPFIPNAINANKYFQAHHHRFEKDLSIRQRRQDPSVVEIVEIIQKKDPEYFKDKFEGLKPSDKIPIMNGATNGDLKILNLFDGKYALEKPDSFGQTPLMEAASRGHLPAVEFIIKKFESADPFIIEKFESAVNSKDQFGQTAIMGAIFYGHRGVVEFLRNKGAILDLGQATKIAAAGGKLDLLLDFIKENDQFDHDSDFEDVLVIAASRNHKNIISHYIDNNSNRENLDKYGRKLLFIAVSRGRMEVMEYLLKQRVELTINDFNDYQYLIEAAANGHHDILQHLLNQTWKSANISSATKLPFLTLFTSQVQEM